jgi:hypothetical protein
MEDGLSVHVVYSLAMSIIAKIDTFLNEKKDRITLLLASPSDLRQMKDAAHSRRIRQSLDKDARADQKRGRGTYTRAELDAADTHEAIIKNAKSIRSVAPDMPLPHVYRAARAGLNKNSHVDEFSAAGVPAKSIAGPLWKMHAVSNELVDALKPETKAHQEFKETPHTSPRDALDLRRHSMVYDRPKTEPLNDAVRTLRNVRDTFSSNMVYHLQKMGIDSDDARIGTAHSSYDTYISPALQKHMDKLPAEPSVADLHKAVKPHLAEVKERTRVESEGHLERGLPHFDEVAMHPLKGLPAGYREATHEDAPALAKWCVKSGACLARAVQGEFGDSHKPHRVVLSPEGHVVGLRRKSDKSTGEELNDYHIPAKSMCCDKDNKHAAGEMAKFEGSSIKHMEEPQIDEYHGKARRAGRLPRAWALSHLTND